MKKKLLTILLSAFMVLASFTTYVFADDDYIYLDTNNVWDKDNKFIAYSITDYSLHPLERVEGNIYRVVKGDITELIFYMIPSDADVTNISELLDKKIKNTNDLTISSGNNCYKITSGNSGENQNGEWTTYDPHTHDFKYSAEGATITIECNITDCPMFLDRISGKLTLVNNNGVISTNKKDGNVHLIDVFSSEQLNNIEYYKGEVKLENPPTESGEYVAKITMGSGDNTATATLAYTYTAPVKISDILPSDFPTTKESGWVVDGQIYKIYHEGTKLKAYVSSMSKEAELELADSTVLTKDGDNYKYSFSHHVESISKDLPITLNFEMKDNKLKTIVVDIPNGVSPSGDFTYEHDKFEPYTYSAVPTTVKEGYTGDLEFVTNAVYTNDSDVTVKVDDATLTLGVEYSLSHGSTHVKLLGDYVKTLAVGTHTITIGVSGTFSEINTQFTISGSSPTPASGYNFPKTGIEVEPTSNHSLLKLSSLSLLAIGTYIVIKKKKDK